MVTLAAGFGAVISSRAPLALEVQNMSNGRPLENQVAIVTGAGQGNGRAIALRLASDGAMVFGTDLRPDLLNELEDTARKSELKIATGVYDASKPADADALVAQVVDAYGWLDIMVNNAGAIWAAPFPDVTEEIWDRTMDLNLKGLYFHMQAAARPMIKQGGGVIINLASIAGVNPGITLSPPYAASKAAVMNLTMSAAMKVAEHGVRVNGVAPGIVDTAFNRNLDRILGVEQEGLPEGEWMRRRGSGIPLGRVSVPEDVAGVVAFLAGPDAAYMTGETVLISGGLVVR